MPFDATPVETNSHTVQLLLAAKALIEDPRDWCQRSPQKILDGRLQRCAYSAAWEAAGCDEFQVKVALRYLNDVSARRGVRSSVVHNPIIMLNDTTDHATVMAAFDEAIALCQTI